jgi:hypothetical protein
MSFESTLEISAVPSSRQVTIATFSFFLAKVFGNVGPTAHVPSGVNPLS